MPLQGFLLKYRTITNLLSVFYLIYKCVIYDLVSNF